MREFRRIQGKVRSPIAGVIAFLVGCSLLYPSPLYAQRSAGSVGIGLQTGRPGGVVAKVYRGDGIAYDAVLTTDADDYVAGYVHRLWEEPIPDSPLHLYFGPGIVGGVESLTQRARLRLGTSAEVGLNFYAERFEVFLHVTPTLRFFPNTRAFLDGNVGLRYYFDAP